MAPGTRPSRREDVLRLLDEAGVPQTVAMLAERLGTHPNTVRLHLDHLVADGRVVRTSSGRGVPGRPAQLYQRAGDDGASSDGGYRMLAEILVEGLAEDPQPQRAAIEVGRRWGRREAQNEPDREPAEGLSDLLDRVGFRRTGQVQNGQVDVCRCPFLDLAREHPDVVCSVHLGLMQGALQAWTDGATTVDRLEHREDVEVCTAHLVARPA